MSTKTNLHTCSLNWYFYNGISLFNSVLRFSKLHGWFIGLVVNIHSCTCNITCYDAIYILYYKYCNTFNMMNHISLWEIRTPNMKYVLGKINMHISKALSVIMEFAHVCSVNVKCRCVPMNVFNYSRTLRVFRFLK